MKTKVNVERVQTGAVEIDIEEVMDAAHINEVIEEAENAGLIDWKNAPIKATSLEFEAFIAHCHTNDEDEDYKFIIVAEDRNSAKEKVEDYMASISDDYVLKLKRADKYEAADYINAIDPYSFEYEGVYEIGEKYEEEEY